MRMKMHASAMWLIAAASLFSVCPVAHPLASSRGFLAFEPGANSARQAHRISFFMQLNELDFSNVEKEVSFFQEDTRLAVVVRPFFLAYGYQRYGNLLEAEFKYSNNKLPVFMNEYYWITIDELCISVWYRRSVPIAIGAVEAGLFPGVGIGYSYAPAYIGRSWDDLHTEVMFASSMTWAAGFQSAIRILGGNDGGSLSLTVDYRYRFDDPPAKHINGGDAFFPNVTAYSFSGHSVLLGLQARWH
jgi:hypothetical protein